MTIEQAMQKARLAAQWAVTVLALMVLALIAVSVTQALGIRVLALPKLGFTELAYAAGALWLVRGAL